MRYSIVEYSVYGVDPRVDIIGHGKDDDMSLSKKPAHKYKLKTVKEDGVRVYSVQSGTYDFTGYMFGIPETHPYYNYGMLIDTFSRNGSFCAPGGIGAPTKLSMDACAALEVVVNAFEKIQKAR